MLAQMGDVFAALASNAFTLSTKSHSSQQVSFETYLNSLKFSLSQVLDLQETYTLLNNICMTQSKTVAEFSSTFSNDFYNFFKFHKDCLTGLKAIVKTRNELAVTYAKRCNVQEFALSNSNYFDIYSGRQQYWTWSNFPVFQRSNHYSWQGKLHTSKSLTHYRVNNKCKTLKDLDEQVRYFNEQTLYCTKKSLQNRCSAYSRHFGKFCGNQ